MEYEPCVSRGGKDYSNLGTDAEYKARLTWRPVVGELPNNLISTYSRDNAMNDRGTRLRALLEENRPVLAPACIDAFSARMVEQAGFEVNYLTGNGASAALLGKPDVGFMTLREVADVCRNIVQATSIPLIADADTGYGNAVNMIRTVRELESAGVACIQIEDQVTPKKCGFLPGSIPVISLEEQLGKLKAALDARQSEDFLILARTDAAADHGLDEAIRRAVAYKEAGADLTFIEVEGTEEELRKIGAEVPPPHATTLDESRREAALSVDELGELGFGVIIYPGIVRCTYLKAVNDVLRILKEEGSTRSAREMMATFQEYNDALGISEVQTWEREYLYDAEAASRKERNMITVGMYYEVLPGKEKGIRREIRGRGRRPRRAGRPRAEPSVSAGEKSRIPTPSSRSGMRRKTSWPSSGAMPFAPLRTGEKRKFWRAGRATSSTAARATSTRGKLNAGYAPLPAARSTRPRAPRFELPPGAWDTHGHIFGPESKYAYSPRRGYTPPDASLDAYETLHRTLGVARGVLTQPSVYGVDNTAMFDAMARSGGRLMGVASVDKEVSEAELTRLHDAGVRGLRINLADKGGNPFDSFADVQAMGERIVDMGWHMEFLIHVHEFPDLRKDLLLPPRPQRFRAHGLRTGGPGSGATPGIHGLAQRGPNVGKAHGRLPHHKP